MSGLKHRHAHQQRYCKHTVHQWLSKLRAFGRLIIQVKSSGIQCHSGKHEVVRFCHSSGECMRDDQALRQLLQPLAMVWTLWPCWRRRRFWGPCEVSSVQDALCLLKMWDVHHLTLKTESSRLWLGSFQKFLRFSHFFQTGRKCCVDDVDLVRMDGEFAVETCVCGLLALWPGTIRLWNHLKVEFPQPYCSGFPTTRISAETNNAVECIATRGYCLKRSFSQQTQSY